MTVNYARPVFDKDFVERRLQKPSKKRAVVKHDRRREKKLTRRQCVETVWRRAKNRCERCAAPVKRKAVTYPTDPERGDVNEKRPKSLGGDPCDPNNCELICGKCHYGGASGAHAPTAARMKRRG